MRLGIDATPLIIQRSGVGYYTKNLVENLLLADKSLEIALFIASLRGQSDELNLEFNEDRVKVIHSRIPARALIRLWSRSSAFPLENLTGKIDIFHGTNYILPVLKNAKGVLTIHDLGFIRFPELCQKETLQMKSSLPASIKRAKRIIAVSEFTRNEIIELLDIEPKKISVTYQGYGGLFQQNLSLEELNNTKLKYKLEMGKFFLFVGTVEPRKNLTALISAFEIVKDKKKIPHKLIIAGGLGWNYNDFLSEKAASKYSSEIILTGYISGHELTSLYRMATCLVFPSLYEGFGLPVLESMANSVPVICSTRASIPEIAGDAALYFNPEDPSEIAEKILELLNDSNLASQLIKKGKRRIKAFSWKKIALKTLAIYEDILKETN